MGFGGWLMPVQYTGILKEHESVRSDIGVFDISHMGEIRVEGAGAEAFLNFVLTNDTRKLRDGQGQYSLLCNEDGGVIDDLYVFRLSEGKYFLVVNAAHIDEDAQWLASHAAGHDVMVTNVSEQFAALAIQGPRSLALLAEKFSLSDIPPKNGIAEASLLGGKILLSRTGYTGEDGVEMFFGANCAAKIWRAFLDAGVTPCGLGCRDTLRLEACYPLNGNDLSPQKTPIESGLGFFVALDKPDLIGRPRLLDHKTNRPPTKLIAFEMSDPKSPPPRSHYKIRAQGREIGEVTSGTLSPSLKKGIGMGYVGFDHSKIGQSIEIVIRDKEFSAVIVPKPFVKKT
ncbi:glycine cleavage system aminomethyltransferase GcvT [Oscillatoria laete-virens NRMC-F 0139]|nr:glycine cleavage system aminomethyltransferase GcvT [Oscillatoria laete-virens NRMC-F 0139]